MAQKAFAFPQRLSNNQMNKPEFESGFSEESLPGGFPSNHYMCSICHGLPRHPVSLDKCGHMFCELCIKEHFRTQARQHSLFSGIKGAPCPNCKGEYTMMNVVGLDRFQSWPHMLFNAITVKCPYTCGFSGTAYMTDEHQVYTCPKRPIDCPNVGCAFQGPAKDVEENHFQTCEQMQIYCEKCRLPMLLKDKPKHDCYARQTAALDALYKRMISVGVVIPKSHRKGEGNVDWAGGKKRMARQRLFNTLPDEDDGEEDDDDDATEDGNAPAAAADSANAAHPNS